VADQADVGFQRTHRAGIVMVQRNEGLLLRLNVAYHLALGFERIVIVDNHSDDLTTIALLSAIVDDPRVRVIDDKSDHCDQSVLANLGLAALLEDGVDWVFPCDADEFIWVKGSLTAFLQQCRDNGILYGTLPWLNHLPEHCGGPDDVLAYVRSGWFYHPEAERDWQQPGHLRKAFCRVHQGMTIIVGGHYFRRDADSAFFATLNGCPALMPSSAGTIVHFELRDCGPALLRKLGDLSQRHIASGVPADGPWREKEAHFGELWAKYRDHPERLFSDFAAQRRTLWGNRITNGRLHRREDISSSLTTLLFRLSPLSPLSGSGDSGCDQETSAR
jgi:glycosyltransferase involved in cell wall biosynthesis